MILQELVSLMEIFAPVEYQESYDNSGLLAGDYNKNINSILLTIDVTLDVIHEAVEKKCDLIISHHPLIFNGIKKITGSNETEKCIAALLKNDIALYSAHTNMDSVAQGVNSKICEKIGLNECKILSPSTGNLCKLVTFVPVEHAEKVRSTLFNAGAGVIGNYDWCSYNLEGTGSFRASEDTNPFVGEKGKLHFEKEIRIETVFPKILQNEIIRALIETHPYEEVAYDIYPLANKYDKVGMGMIGTLTEPVDTKDFLKRIKEVFSVPVIRHTNLIKDKIIKVAVCGGSGSFLINKAIGAGADIFLTGDIKYHQFFEAENRIILADIGHYESEQFTKEIFYELLIKKIPNFALHFSKINTNPIIYF